MTNASNRQHDAFDNPAKALCRAGNLRVLREAAYRPRERLVTMSDEETSFHPARGVAVSEAVHKILDRIDHLPPAERLELEGLLAQQAEAEWQSEAEVARRFARQKGIDQAAIDRAVDKVRHGT